jgi:hypothetical protein
MIRSLLAAVALLVSAPFAIALPVMPFTDTETFAEKATDVLVAECLDPDAAPGPKLNGVTAVEVNVLKVLKGDRKTGKTKLATIGQPMEKGRRYMMASFGGKALDTGFLANAELAVVEIPSGFDPKTLDGKTTAEQVQLVFDARREQVRQQLLQFEREKALLAKSAPKEPAKLKPYTDEEAAAFVKRAEELAAEVTAGKRKHPTTFEAALEELKIDPKRLGRFALHVGNATDWHEYQLSPNYRLTVAYTQQAAKENAFRDLRITKVKPE